jgi:type II secretory pathway component GspD/PulD (secretin)
MNAGRRWSAIGLLMLTAAGCATGQNVSKGQDAARKGDWDAAVAYYRQAMAADPKDIEARVGLERAMREAAMAHITRAKKLETEEQWQGAAQEYRLAVEFEPSNAMALSRALALERKVRDIAEASRPRTRMEEMQRQATAASPIPKLDPRTPVPALHFNNTSLRDIFSQFSIATGINITYDQNMEGTLSRGHTIDTTDVPLENVLNQIMQAFGLTYKVLDQRSIFIYQDNAGNRGKYEDLYQQTFYLSNAEVGEVSTILNQLLTTTTTGNRPAITQHKSLNSITVRASAPMMGIIDNIIKTADKPRAEVLIEVTILEVSRTRMRELGIDLSQYAIGLAFSPAGVPGNVGTTFGTPPPFNIPQANAGGRNDVYLAIPSATIKLLESDNKTRLLAKPQLRGREGSQLTLNLGDRVPIPQTTFQAAATGGVATIPQTTYAYQQIGVNVNMTPKVTYQDEIILDPIVVDKSGLGQNILVAGQLLPTFVNRTASTAMRLRDGESNLLAGLIRQEDREIANSLPGISQIPILRSFFGTTNTTTDSSDIIMIVTPHIIRSREITAEDLKPLYVGTSTNPGAGTTPSLISPGAPPPPAIIPGQPGQPTQPGAIVPTTGAGNPPAGAPPATTRAPGVVAIEPVNPAGAPAPQPAGARVSVTAPDVPLQMGGPPYTMPVKIDGVSQLGQATVTITYDPKVLRAVSVSPGAFMQQGGIQPTFVPKIDEATGRIDIAIARPATAPGASGTDWLAGIVFQAVGAGQSRISVTAVLMTASGQPIAVQTVPATVVVK